MNPLTLHLPPGFQQRLERCAKATSGGSTATMILRLLVGHVAAWEATEFADTPPVTRVTQASPWLATDASWYAR